MEGARPAANAAPLAQEFRRFERKFPVDPRRLDLIGAWLGHACRPAPAFPEGRVTSCYFDSPDWDAYFEAVDGDFDKRKVRLRWYDELPASGPVDAYLEVKEKAGFATRKRRVLLSLDAGLLREGAFVEALPRGRLEGALAGAGAYGESLLTPAVVVSYWRLRYADPGSGVSLALDSQISAWPARRGATAPTIALPAAVLEVKGASLELPPRLRGIGRFASTWAGHSKYALAVEALARAVGLESQ